jgi:hypothetical protein
VSIGETIREYLETVLGDTTGYLHIMVGIGGYFTETGKYEFRERVHPSFAWPAEAELAVNEIARAADEHDTYVCPYVMLGTKRNKSSAADLRLVHADIDGPLSLNKVRDLGGFAVSSGTPGHGHAYVRLSEKVTLQQHRALCEGLGNYLGHADTKKTPSDVLRPPGTLNHKCAARGGQPSAVTW